MSDTPQTPQAVAFALLREVAAAESLSFQSNGYGDRPSREWILQAYADCLYTVNNPNLKAKA